jgi:holin-like protein
MLLGLVLLILLQFFGEGIARITGLPVPGPVIGLAFLAGAALVWPKLLDLIAPAADALLRHLSLLFIPAGVGILQHIGLVRAEAFAIVSVLIGSTLVTLVVTALVFRALAGPIVRGSNE